MHLSTRILAAALVLAGASGAAAQATANRAAAVAEFNNTATIAVSDVRKAQAELAALFDSIMAERLPLSKRIEELETETLRQRREADRVTRLRDNSSIDLGRLERLVANYEEVNRYLSTLIGDHRRRFETQLHISELQRYQAKISEARIASENVTLSELEKFEVQLTLLDQAADRIDELIGGARFAGNAVFQGIEETGTFALFGPVAVFASANGVGIVELEVNREVPTVHAPPGSMDGMRRFAETGEGTISLDTTLGDAQRIAMTRETLWEHISKGGLVIYPIIAIGLLAMGIFIFKLIEVGSVRPARKEDVTKILALLKEGKQEEAAAIANRVKGPAGELLQGAVANYDGDREILEEVLYERIITTQPKLERFTPFIAITAATAPLMGLLGTVTGMIATFKLITVFGTGDARRLSSGISEALITTEFGLIVAIPCLILHAILTRYTKRVVNSMEQNAVTLINGISEIKEGSSR